MTVYASSGMLKPTQSLMLSQISVVIFSSSCIVYVLAYISLDAL